MKLTSGENNFLEIIRNWIKNYENTKEHDIDFTIDAKDSAYELLKDIEEYWSDRKS